MRSVADTIVTEEQGPEGNDTLWTACDNAWEALNTYWQKTDEQTAIVISLILDPRFKLDPDTLERLGWKRNHIRQAKRHFERIYNDFYLLPDAAAEPEVMIPAADPLRLLFPPRAARVLDPQLETTRWLDEPLANWEMDGPTYWKLYSDRYPKGLANMARDYLAIPASSVPAERLFSSAGLLTFSYQRTEHAAKIYL
jgi:hypothetical protein